MALVAWHTVQTCARVNLAAAFARAQPMAPDAGELAGATDWLWMSLARAGRRGIRKAHRRYALGVHRDAVGAGEGAEVMIERPVLQHDEDQVVEVHDAGGRVERARAIAQG